MSAEIRLTLSDEQTAKLDAIRQPASRTAYAGYLLDVAINNRHAEFARAGRLAPEAGQ